MALLYNNASFAIAIDDFWQRETPHADYQQTLGSRVQRILLLPSLEETILRLHQRNEPNEFRDLLEWAVRFVQNDVRTHPESTKNWHVIDSSHQNVEQTVDQILEKITIIS
jgi:hypothetical protein